MDLIPLTVDYELKPFDCGDPVLNGFLCEKGCENMDVQYIFVVIAIIVALILLYLGFIHLIKNKRLNQEFQSTLPIQELIEALGGQGNIKEVRSSASKVTVVLVNQQLVDIDKIKALGASGIVEGASSLAMIFGRQSENIAADLRRYIG